MREKIISQLKAKFSGVNLSKARMDAIADRLTPKITDEAEIDGKLDELNEFFPFAEIAKQDDKLRNLETATKAKTTTQADGQKSTQQQNQDGDQTNQSKDEVPAWAKALIESNKTLQEQLAGVQKKTKQDTLLAEARKAGVPEKFALKFPISDDFNLENALDEIKNEWDDLKQYSVNASVGDGKVLKGAPTGKEKASKEELDAALSKI